MQPLEGIRVLGTAFTVLNYPDDNITTHKALTMLEPGDVLVIDEGRENNTGAFGHNMSLQARNRGVAGFISNGCMRDIALLRKERFPAFCRSVCPRSAQKNTPGSINVPVQVGGLVVSPGDIVVGDDDGVAVGAEIINVTKEGTKCSTFAECKELLENGEDIDYDGASGSVDFIDAGEPSTGTYEVWSINAEGQVETVSTQESTLG